MNRRHTIIYRQCFHRRSQQKHIANYFSYCAIHVIDQRILYILFSEPHYYNLRRVSLQIIIKKL